MNLGKFYVAHFLVNYLKIAFKSFLAFKRFQTVMKNRCLHGFFVRFAQTAHAP